VGEGNGDCGTKVSGGTLNASDPALSHTNESISPAPPSAMAILKVYIVPAVTSTVLVLSIVVRPSISVLSVLPTLDR
jgi:hypothetical protein